MSDFGVVALFWGGILVRVIVALFGYSGQGRFPMFGDFEAQRHWMEITTNLPVGEWYQDGPLNDLQYWGLDYPPLTAYVSYLFGAVAFPLLPELVELSSSRGYESLAGKSFMRASVILCDSFVYIPTALMASVSMINKLQSSWNVRLMERAKTNDGRKKPDFKKQVEKGMFLIAVCLIAHPGLLLIDHGHFQYNGVCIGLTLMSMRYILSGEEVLGSIMFCLSLNFKQMALYYSPVFFFVLLQSCCATAVKHGRLAGLLHLTKTGVIVIVTFAALWSPFCLFPRVGATCLSSCGQVLHRLFPFARGIFEDKVANLWYALSVLIDFRNFAHMEGLVRTSLMLTLLLLVPVAISLLVTPLRAALISSSASTSSSSSLAQPTSPVSFVLGLVVSALAFFLASFQVHEKSLLLATVPAALLITVEPLFISWFQTLGLFTMFPLLQKDHLVGPYWTCFAVYSLGILYSLRLPYEEQSLDNGRSRIFLVSEITQAEAKGIAGVPKGEDDRYNRIARVLRWAFKSFVFLSLLGMLSLHALEYFCPLLWASRYPDLYPALFSIYGAANLCVAYTVFAFWLVSYTYSMQGASSNATHNGTTLWSRLLSKKRK